MDLGFGALSNKESSPFLESSDLSSGSQSCSYKPLKDPENKPFRLALTRKKGTSGEADILPSFGELKDERTYRMIEKTPEAYGVVEPKPDSMPEYKDWLTDYLSRAMLTATDKGGGGIALNLNGYTPKHIQAVVELYKKGLAEKQFKEPKATFLTHNEFMSMTFPKGLMKTEIGMDHENPGFTDWEIAAILNHPQLLQKTEFYDVPSSYDKQGYPKELAKEVSKGETVEEYASMWGYTPNTEVLKPISKESLADKYGIKIG